MQLIDFVDACDIGSKSTAENFGLFCYYLFKENGAGSFSVKNVAEMYGEAGLPVPELSSLKKEVRNCGYFRPYGIEGTLKFTKDQLRALDKKYGHMWSNTVKISPETQRVSVPLKNFIEACSMASRTDIENFGLLCYYLAKENGYEHFMIRNMIDVCEDAGLTRPERSALEKEVRKSGSFRLKSFDGSVEFTPDAYRALDDAHGHMWTVVNAPVAAPVNCEVIDEAKFCGKREGLDRLIIQINSTYRDGSFDACAAVMRRLLEVSIIFAFQSNGMEKDVRGADGRYLCLDALIDKI
ncbi:MAG: hypothetical protein LBE47_00260, partial [Methanomassiliicoccaceae archaeon]|nr:hypothetical protein [Methanomassiliicoccaceae archaeon]